LADAKAVITAGADKVSIGSAAVKHPSLINEITEALGRDKLVVAIDFKTSEEGNYVYVKGGTERTAHEVLDWAKEAERRGAVEILLTSMNRDGAKNGFDIETTNLVSRTLNIPLIASGGAGKIEDFVTLFKETYAD